MTIVEELKEVVDKNVLRMEPEIQGMPIEDSSVYAHWLGQTYYFVLHSTRLLALTSSRFPLDKNDFHYRYAEHVKEERGHENLALNDLKNIGWSIKNVPEFSETKAFYQTQYYQIEHVSPIAFWGYVLCLEVFAISGGVKLYERVCNAHGDSAGIFLKVHVKEDEGHVAEAFDILEGITKNEKEIIISNLEMSCDLYANIYSRISKSVNPFVEKQAA